MFNYILTVSAILNSVLLMFLFGPLPFFLYVSVILNIFCIWYTIRLFRQESDLREDVLEIFNSIESFSDHLDKLHGLETFYGDEDLRNLIDHSRELINEIVDLQEKYYDDIEIEMETYDDDTEKTKTAPEEVE